MHDLVNSQYYLVIQYINKAEALL